MLSATLALKPSLPASRLPRRSLNNSSRPRIRIPQSSNLSIPLGNGLHPVKIGLLFREVPKIPISTCFCKPDGDLEPSSDQKVSAAEWQVLQRWEVPWDWKTVLLTIFACGLSFTLAGLTEYGILSYLGIQGGDVDLDGKAGLLFAGQLSATIAVLVVLFSITNKFQPLPDDILRYDLKRPFDLKDGWLLWAVAGLLCSFIAVYLTGAALTIVNGENMKRETDALVHLLPLLGSSNVSTAYLLGITGVLAPLLEETVFRGFLMASLTKWFPTPVSIVLSATAFSLAHFTPGEFPQLFVLGITLGLSYAQTRNLLAPITLHGLWNSGVIIFLTVLQLQGYDIRELLQATS